MTEHETLATCLRAVAGAAQREGERCEPWSPLAAAAWRARAKRVEELGALLPDVKQLRAMATACETSTAHAETEQVGERLYAAADLLRALAGE